MSVMMALVVLVNSPVMVGAFVGKGEAVLGTAGPFENVRVLGVFVALTVDVGVGEPEELGDVGRACPLGVVRVVGWAGVDAAQAVNVVEAACAAAAGQLWRD
jgi:hypothetical protein